MAKCPISCGKCCADWGHVSVLWTPETKHLDLDDVCPHLCSSGCELSRAEMPRVCRDHLCDRALSALEARSSLLPDPESKSRSSVPDALEPDQIP